MTSIKPIKVGVVGCGTISSIYLENAQKLDTLEIVAVADLYREAAEKRAAEFDIPQVYSLEELLADPEIELVLNLTTPNAHAEVALAALHAGKSVYGEKPLALHREEGRQIVALAKEKGLQIGGAPDTFLGAGHQTCRQLIDDGALGQPMAATAFMMGWGMEMWHPNPEFYFKPGGGPMFDMGPYYLTDLIFLLGPVARVTGMNTIGRKQRTITSQPLAGKVIEVEVPTHVAGLLEFESGVIGTIITSFEVAGSTLPRIEIYGTAGTLSVPDPNFFGGEVLLKRPGEKEWEKIEYTQAHPDNARGLGLADMASALRTGEPHRANGDLSYHVLDLMHAFHEAADQGHHISLQSTCERPDLLPAVFGDGA